MVKTGCLFALLTLLAILCYGLARADGAGADGPALAPAVGIGCTVGGDGAFRVFDRAHKVTLGGVSGTGSRYDCGVATAAGWVILVARGTDGQYVREAPANDWADAGGWTGWVRLPEGD